MNKFKVGDICVPRKGHEDECETFVGYEGVKVAISGQDDYGHYHYNILGKNGRAVNSCFCFCETDLELATGKNSKPVKAKPVKYLVGWEEDSDPYEKFGDEKEMKLKVKELLKDEAVEKESIEVFEIRNHWKVKSNTSFKLVKA